jgi:hypothetical protein
MGRGTLERVAGNPQLQALELRDLRAVEPDEDVVVVQLVTERSPEQDPAAGVETGDDIRPGWKMPGCADPGSHGQERHPRHDRAEQHEARRDGRSA